jgi:putative tryptophan/tyrosine transport system substrate-binding protein
MKRREFITLLSGAGAAWPLSARAQQPDRMRRIGVIMAIEGDDPQTQSRLARLRTGLQQRGWIDGRNLRIDLRSGVGADMLRKSIAESIALAPDVRADRKGQAQLATVAALPSCIRNVFF